MRLDMILIMGGLFATAGTLLGWLTLWPSFRRMAQDLRIRDWNLAHLRAEHADQTLLFQSLMEHGPQVVVRLDAVGQPIYVSPSCQAIVGYTPTDMRRRTDLDLPHSTVDARINVRHPDGHIVALSASTRNLPHGQGAAVILTDITELTRTEALLAEARGKLRQRALRDSLTGLANRACFLATLERALTDDKPVAVLLLDLDRFRPTNDRYGHDAGDRLLRQVADRLIQAMAGALLVARLGDDDFAVLLRCTEGDSAVAAAVRDLIRALLPPFPIGPATVDIGASIGIAVSPRDGDCAIGLLRAADIAMTHARASGGGTYRFFEARMMDALARADALRRELPAAIAAGEVLPYFQPMVRMHDNTIVGFEVLARWSHPAHGVLLPAEFLPLAEENGLSAAIFESILTRACLTALDWPAHVKIAVHLSPVELRDPDLPGSVRDILTSTGFPGERLEVEITENALVHDAKIARDVLARLRELGCTSGQGFLPGRPMPAADADRWMAQTRQTALASD